MSEPPQRGETAPVRALQQPVLCTLRETVDPQQTEFAALLAEPYMPDDPEEIPMLQLKCSRCGKTGRASSVPNVTCKQLADCIANFRSGCPRGEQNTYAVIFDSDETT